LLFDLPCGFAVQQLPRLAHSPVRLIIVTYNPCPEYWEDVWELQPAGLAVNLPFDQTLLDTLEATARGERRRLTPPMMSSLTATERRLLRCVARGWDNRRIAQHLHVEEKSVRNRLTHVYAKIPVSNRVEAALYYWGRVDLFT
jgi:DNA-binding NarL/FixJ family response regulator